MTRSRAPQEAQTGARPASPVAWGRRSWHRLGIRRRLLLVLLAVSVVPLVSFSVASLAALEVLNGHARGQAGQALLASQDAHVSQLVSARASIVNGELGSIQDELELLRQQVASALVDPTPVGAAAGSRTVLVDPAPGASRGAPGTTARLAAVTGPMNLVTELHTEVAEVWVRVVNAGVLQIVPANVVTRAQRSQFEQLLPSPAIYRTAVERQSVALAPHSVWRSLVNAIDRSAFWTRVYQNPLAGGPTVTVVAPGTTGGGVAFQVGANITVPSLVQNFLSSPPAGTHGSFAFLLSSDGRLLSVGRGGTRLLGLPPGWHGETPAVLTGHRPGLRRMVAAMTRGMPGQATVHFAGQPFSVFYSPLPASQWSLAVAVPANALQASVVGLSSQITAGITGILAVMVPAVLALAALVLVAAQLLSKRLIRPLEALTTASGRIAGGDLDTPVAGGTDRDEIGALERALERMRRRLSLQRTAIEAGRRELEARVDARTRELQQRTDEVGLLYALTSELGRSLVVGEVAAAAAEQLRDLLGLRGAFVYLLDALDRPPGRLVGRAVADGQADPLPSAACLGAVARSHAGAVEAGEQFVIVPLVSGGARLGLLLLERSAPSPTSERQLELLRIVGGQLGLALRNAQLFADSQELATINERNRLAREIHDTLAQGLAGIVIQLQGAEGWLAQDPNRSREALRQAIDLARANLNDARRSVWDLRPSALQRAGLTGAIRDELARVRLRTGTRASLRTANLRQIRLPASVEVSLFRVAQEAISNAARHSGAHHITVTLAVQGPDVVMTVEDDGAGFDPAVPAGPRSFGLTSMAERIHGAGGRLRIDSASQRGTVVTARVPRLPTGPGPVPNGDGPGELAGAGAAAPPLPGVSGGLG
ncbi:MAG TPA: histidine kinase [Candidatus Dormibacteraeota bacterium]|nr:histidine kinase [Candidatus Dormibacteraeota bacterium]